jgi:hypothetical protein
MAQEIQGEKQSATATASLTQYTFVRPVTGAMLSVSTAATAASAIPCGYLGVVQNAPASGQIAEVMITGVTKLVADTAIVAGQFVTIAAGGRAGLAAAGAQAAGVATTSTTASGQYVSVRLLRGVVAL